MSNKNPNPVRTKWDMPHKSKKDYDRKNKDYELEEMPKRKWIVTAYKIYSADIVIEADTREEAKSQAAQLLNDNKLEFEFDYIASEIDWKTQLI